MFSFLHGLMTFLDHLLNMTPTCHLHPDVSHILVEGDVALSKKRNSIKCWNDYCKWRKSFNGLVEVPYSFSDYFCEEPIKTYSLL